MLEPTSLNLVLGQRFEEGASFHNQKHRIARLGLGQQCSPFAILQEPAKRGLRWSLNQPKQCELCRLCSNRAGSSAGCGGRAKSALQHWVAAETKHCSSPWQAASAYFFLQEVLHFLMETHVRLWESQVSCCAIRWIALFGLKCFGQTWIGGIESMADAALKFLGAAVFRRLFMVFTVGYVSFPSTVQCNSANTWIKCTTSFACQTRQDSGAPIKTQNYMLGFGCFTILRDCDRSVWLSNCIGHQFCLFVIHQFLPRTTLKWSKIT